MGHRDKYLCVCECVSVCERERERGALLVAVRLDLNRAPQTAAGSRAELPNQSAHTEKSGSQQIEF